MHDTVAPGTPYLIHSFEHRAYPLPADRPLSIGRETSCDITVNEVAVSRHHAEIRTEGEEFVLNPVGSTSTILNGAPLIAPSPLTEGDLFTVGTMKFVFTRDRLPVAMKIAVPAERYSTVEGRRPTLTFPAQPASPDVAQPSKSANLMMFAVAAIVVVGLLGYWVLAQRS